ncbi:hypothetical protein RHMOL_Rhmol05G0173100 [Rhododendron molle]|uniref:Uncharacterized protein n=1 Tax=Rhododendron molle TaxID=49168 RepID=A0ACC0NQ97_RHOML|nr:hypothetical protein RHMOL_Rhmol05G0173100 [Rhododendron molle]
MGVWRRVADLPPDYTTKCHLEYFVEVTEASSRLALEEIQPIPLTAIIEQLRSVMETLAAMQQTQTLNGDLAHTTEEGHQSTGTSGGC